MPASCLICLQCDHCIEKNMTLIRNNIKLYYFKEILFTGDILVPLISILQLFCLHFLCKVFFYKQLLLWILICGMLAQTAFHCTLLLAIGLNIRKNSINCSQFSTETVSYWPDPYSQSWQKGLELLTLHWYHP